MGRAKRRTGSTVRLPALHVADQDRDQVAELAAVQAAAGETVTLACVDQGSAGEVPRRAAAARGITLEVVTLPEVKRRLVLLPRRWVVERDVDWTSRFRRLARDQERLAEVLKGSHLVAVPMRTGKQALLAPSVL